MVSAIGQTKKLTSVQLGCDAMTKRGDFGFYFLQPFSTRPMLSSTKLATNKDRLVSVVLSPHVITHKLLFSTCELFYYLPAMKLEPLFYPSLCQAIPPELSLLVCKVSFPIQSPVTFCFFPASPPLVAWTLFNLAVHVENDLNLPAFYGFSGHFLFPFFSLPLKKE